MGGNSSSTNGTSNPQEMLKIFRETQENMMELNRSRLAALEEVKTLRARVALLGEEPSPPLQADGHRSLRMSWPDGQL